jgi:hypothetical protein
LSKFKDKEKIKKQQEKKKQITQKAVTMNEASNFTAETTKAIREWDDTFRGLQGVAKTPRQKLREFTITSPVLQKVLMRILEDERKICYYHESIKLTG